MTKLEFLDALKARLTSLPNNEVYRLTGYYAEMIDDRVESGMSEEEAVGALGSMDSIIEGIMYDMSLPKLMRAKVNESKNRSSNKAVWIILVILGFPLWLPVLIGFFTMVFSLFMMVWGAILGLYAMVVGVGLAGIGCIVGGGIYLFASPFPESICVIGAGLCLVGAALFLLKPVSLIAGGLVKLTALLGRKIKSLFIRKKEI